MLKLGHKNLDTWIESIQLTAIIYKITATFPKAALYGITSQMRRSSVSISSNVAEGASRSSQKERKRFYEIPRSSLVELDTQLELSLELNLMAKDQVKLSAKLNSLFAKLTNQIKNT